MENDSYRAGLIWALTNAWAFINRKKFQNPQNITVHGNCNSKAPIIRGGTNSFIFLNIGDKLDPQVFLVVVLCIKNNII